MAVAMDAMAVAIHIKYALNQNRYLIHTNATFNVTGDQSTLPTQARYFSADVCVLKLRIQSRRDHLATNTSPKKWNGGNSNIDSALSFPLLMCILYYSSLFTNER